MFCKNHENQDGGGSEIMTSTLRYTESSFYVTGLKEIFLDVFKSSIFIVIVWKLLKIQREGLKSSPSPGPRRPIQVWIRLRPRPHCNGEIWKRRFHSENASNVFRPHYAGGIWKRNNNMEVILDLWLRKTWLGRGNDTIIAMLSFSKSSVFKLFSVHTKTTDFNV